MRITTKGRYALRATLALARLSDGQKPISIKTISEVEAISPEFLEQIFFRLRKSGMISSVRGPGGGFFFSKALDKINLKDILEASGEGLGIAPCICGKKSDCEREDDCVAGAVWRSLGNHMDSFLEGQTLAAMLVMPPSLLNERA